MKGKAKQISENRKPMESQTKIIAITTAVVQCFGLKNGPGWPWAAFGHLSHTESIRKSKENDSRINPENWRRHPSGRESWEMPSEPPWEHREETQAQDSEAQFCRMPQAKLKIILYGGQAPQKLI